MRIVCISDTHEFHRDVEVPDGDLLIHAGDFTYFSKRPSMLFDFDDWLGSLPHEHKVVVPGNHEFSAGRPAASSCNIQCHLAHRRWTLKLRASRFGALRSRRYMGEHSECLLGVTVSEHGQRFLMPQTFSLRTAHHLASLTGNPLLTVIRVASL